MEFIDTHSHLNFPAYDADRKEVIERMKNQKVTSIDVGTTLETSKAAAKLAQKHDLIWAAIGIHPSHATGKRFFDKNELRQPPKGPEIFNEAIFQELLKTPKIVAIGECGLDYFRIKNNSLKIKESQRKLFEKHINLAKKTKLPIIIHCRPSFGSYDAYDDLLAILKEHQGKLSGTIHFYTGNIKYAQKFIALGFHISLSGVITFVKEYDFLGRELPLDKILIETDCPYAAPAPYRGKRNEPIYVIAVAKKIAQLKNIPLEEVAYQTAQNAKKLFNINF